MQAAKMGFFIATLAVLSTSGPTVAIADDQLACRPSLAVTKIQLSNMLPPTRERKWTAIVLVDASRCVANSSGYFEVGFSRLKENAPEVNFTEEFAWLSSSVMIGLDLWADEAIEHQWIGRVSPCRCAE